MTKQKRHSQLLHFVTVFWIVLVVGVTAGCLGLFAIYQLSPGEKEIEDIHFEKNELAAGWEKIETDEIAKKDEAAGETMVEDSELILSFAGDILFDDKYSPMISLRKRTNGIFDSLSEELMDEIHSADIFMVNNEFPYSNRGTPTEGKMYTFRANPENTNYLIDMGVDIVSLANNHAYDYGEDAFLDTLDTLDNMNIAHIGAGRNIKEAAEPVYFSQGDLTVAYIAATQIERIANPDTKGAGENSAGVFRCLDPEKLYEVIKKTKQKADFVIVYVHWGTENTDTPDWAQLEQSKGMVEAGADLIVGDHPHCLQGIDVIENTPVIYSLGNFWFNSKELRTCVVKVKVDKEGIKNMQFLPAYQKGCRTTLSSGGEKEDTLQYMRTLSPNVTIDTQGNIIW